MRFVSRALLRLPLILGAMAVAFAAHAQQDYPTRPITIVVPFPPGASTDNTARALLPKMSEVLGQPIVVDNRGGSGGNVGTSHVAHSAPDGYTLLLTVNPPVSMNKHMFRNLPYDPETDLEPIGLVARSVMALAVHPSLPVENVAELIEYARERPGQVQFGSAGIGSAHHINGEVIKRETGIDIVHVPYPGGGPAIADLVGGHIAMSFGTLPAVLPHMESGGLRVIAVAQEERYERLPDIPTISETIPGVGVASWIGLLAPGGTPREIVDKVNDALLQALAQPQVQELYASQGIQVQTSSPDELRELIASDLAKYEELFPQIGIEPQ